MNFNKLMYKGKQIKFKKPDNGTHVASVSAMSFNPRAEEDCLLRFHGHVWRSMGVKGWHRCRRCRREEAIK